MVGCAAPKKRFWKWIWEDVIVACFVAAGLDVLIKTEWPKLLKVLSEMTGSHLKEQVENDKRAEMVREFRRMEDAGININNIIRRHALAMKKSKPVPEWKFVQLLCKIPPPDPTDPSAVRPPVVPGKRGVPQNERQADLKWLNNMSDKEFNQMLYFLDHDVVRQWGGLLGERVERITSALRSRCGRAGRAIATAMGAIADATLHFLESLGRSPLRLIATGIVLLPIALFTAIIISPIRRRVFPWFGIANGVLLVTVAYWLLVPTPSDKTLWSAWLLLLAAAFFLWRFAWARNTIFGLLVLFTLIFFLGGRTVAKVKWERGWAEKWSNHVAATEPSSQKIADLQSKVAEQNYELASLRRAAENSKPTPPTTGDNTQQNIEQPLASPRPEETPDTANIAEPEPPPIPTHCGTVESPLSPIVQYGEFQLTIEHCIASGTQIIVSGTVQYRGTEKRLLAFHRFRISDGASGAVYTVQSGTFGNSKDFGMGYSWEWMDPGSTIGFSFTAGTVSTPPNGIHLTLPNNQTTEGFTFNDLIERVD